MLQVKGSLKRDFLDIYLATFFGVRNFINKSAINGLKLSLDVNDSTVLKFSDHFEGN